MGRFINADAFATTGQGLNGNNMFAYCGNNPTARIDTSGNLWGIVVGVVAAIATINDIYQILRDDNEKITATKTGDEKSVQISNSVNVVTPWAQLGYSIYLNHFSEHKDYFIGSSVGMMFEWTIHNLGFYAFATFEKVGDLLNLDTTATNKYKNSCSEVDLGPTIYHDSGEGARGIMSAVMKIGYGISYPRFALFDAVTYYVN